MVYDDWTVTIHWFGYLQNSEINDKKSSKTM